MKSRKGRRGPVPAIGCGLAAIGLLAGAAAPAAASGTARGTVHPDDAQDCTFPAHDIKGTPWSLQRLLLDELWKNTTGRGVRVAVIDTGVDDSNKQLSTAIATDHGHRLGTDVLHKGGDGTSDTVGHGTKVAGIIAARKSSGTGFVGIAPGAAIIPVRQNDDQSNGTPKGMAQGIEYAVHHGAGVINISQDTAAPQPPGSALADAVQDAVRHDVVVVAAAGNDGANGKRKDTYPAALPGVLAVGASDRNDERAPFSQSGDFVGVAAPGVDMVSTVPKGGQCVDNGTSFSAPYVAGVAALIRAKHPDWTARETIAQIEETAQRADRGRNAFVGWGVVDPVKALTDDSKPVEKPTPDPDVLRGTHRVVPARLTLGETPHQRQERIASYVLGGGVVTVTLIAGASVALRDLRRRRGAGSAG